MHYSPPVSFAHGILQARILEQVAFPPREDLSSSGIKTHISCVSRVGRQILYHWAIWKSGRKKIHCLLFLFSHEVMSDSLWPHELQHARLPCPLLSPGVCSNSCPFSQWCHPTFYLLPPSPPAFPLSQQQSLFLTGTLNANMILMQKWLMLVC